MKSCPMKRYRDGTGPKIAHGTRYYELEIKFQSLWAIRGLLKNSLECLELGHQVTGLSEQLFHGRVVLDSQFYDLSCLMH